ncbi:MULTISPECIES: aminodeoxychorismate lyase [unclassified Thioalkalivibrio]|uniref:aminodeoxychorismate lyase n=1 Tax=unclassified Thioalkalivibrio TaxID=2621013 RepID=UPI00037075FE|nr:MULTISPECIES: aminodeoxychorismate lyase [unclassified Thioalkalivibrio]
MILVNGEPDENVSVGDRGLLLGDGLFETLRVRSSQPQLWAYHRDRLWRGLRQLGFPEPEEGQILEEVARVAHGPECLVRVTITRGGGPRGYAPPAHPAPTRIVSAGPALDATPPGDRSPLVLGWSAVPVGVNPALAGLKHTSRLEQVMVRSHWETGWEEAIVCDALGRVISATQGNLWVREGQQLLTPPLDQAGIAGTRRAWILDHAAGFGFSVVEEYPETERIRQADGIYITNARLGMTPAVLAEADNPGRAWQDDPLYRMGIALHEAH